MDAKLPFRIVLRPEPEGGYTVIVPTLQGCITRGENVEDALKMAEDAIRAYIASMKKHGEDVDYADYVTVDAPDAEEALHNASLFIKKIKAVISSVSKEL